MSPSPPPSFPAASPLFPCADCFPKMAAAASEERTKHIAMMKHVQEVMYKAYGKDPAEVDEGKLARLAMVAKSSSDVTTAARNDRRFPNTNQASNCWTAFNEFQLCVDKRGERDPLCLQRGRDYTTICPKKWVDDWKDQAEKGASMSVGTAYAEKK